MSTPTIRQAVAVCIAANATVTLGAGTAIGDLLLIFHGNDFSTAAGMNTPTSSQTLSGMTLQATSDMGTNFAHIKLWTAVVTVAGSQTVTTNTVAGEETSCHVIVINGSTVDTGAFIDGSAATGGNTTATASQVAPAVSPVTSDALLLCMTQSDGLIASSVTYTPPSGMSEQTDATDGSFDGSSAASLILSASGSTGTKTFTASAAKGYATVSIAVKGAAAAAAVVQSARPGKTWRRRFKHPKVLPAAPPAAAAIDLGPPEIVMRPRIPC